MVVLLIPCFSQVRLVTSALSGIVNDKQEKEFLWRSCTHRVLRSWYLECICFFFNFFWAIKVWLYCPGRLGTQRIGGQCRADVKRDQGDTFWTGNCKVNFTPVSSFPGYLVVQRSVLSWKSSGPAPLVRMPGCFRAPVKVCFLAKHLLIICHFFPSFSSPSSSLHYIFGKFWKETKVVYDRRLPTLRQWGKAMDQSIQMTFSTLSNTHRLVR